MIQRPKACATELVPGTESAGTQLPCLTPREELVLKQRMRLACVRAKHQPQTKQVSVYPTAGRRLTRQRGVRL